MANKGTGKVRVRIYVHEQERGRSWVPYKTLIGPPIGLQVIVGGWASDHLYSAKRFPSLPTALEEAHLAAWNKLHAMFGDTKPVVEFEVIRERSRW